MNRTTVRVSKELAKKILLTGHQCHWRVESGLPEDAELVGVDGIDGDLHLDFETKDESPKFTRVELTNIHDDSEPDTAVELKEIPEWLKDISILRLEPGDTVVLRHPGQLETSQSARLQLTLKRMLAHHGIENIPVMILEEGMEIGVLRGGGVQSPQSGQDT